MNQHSERTMETDSIPRSMLSLGVPIMIGMVFPTLDSIGDTLLSTSFGLTHFPPFLFALASGKPLWHSDCFLAMGIVNMITAILNFVRNPFCIFGLRIGIAVVILLLPIPKQTRPLSVSPYQYYPQERERYSY